MKLGFVSLVETGSRTHVQQSEDIQVLPRGTRIIQDTLNAIANSTSLATEEWDENWGQDWDQSKSDCYSCYDCYACHGS
jgi:hypothetical protein